MQLTEDGFGRDGARQRPGCRATDAVRNHQNERGSVHGNKRRSAHRRDVARFQIRNQKGILIVVPDQADIRDPENFCNQFWLERSVVTQRREPQGFPGAEKDSVRNRTRALPMRIRRTRKGVHVQPGKSQ